MNGERWSQVERLFHAALEQSSEARPAFLEQACGGDRELRREVEVLLSKDAHAGSLFEKPLLTDATLTMAGPGWIIGRQIGSYRVISQLGAGGMGEVYRAHDDKLGRDVALKMLPSEFARDASRLARFRREARTLASLNHPNIAAIYGLEETGEADCLVLELVEGETLRGPLPLKKAMEIARQIAEAVEAAHEKGIVHRDLKPANIKVTPEGRVKVLDFGLAKAILGTEPAQDLSQMGAADAAQTLAGHVIGTPGYMSPEQARGQEVDQRIDIWAFGCVLYELLAGKRVFGKETAANTLAAVLEQEPDWSALPAKTPAKIRELLRACLQKDPARRLESIADARRAIEQVSRGWNRWAVAAAAAVALVAAGIGGFVWMRPARTISDPSQWLQLTKFSDSVLQPSLSPDGKMVAFIRGPQTFTTPGELYVKILPDGEPQQLTHDGTVKMSPVFTPDGSQIAYTVEDVPKFQWDTWMVPVLGGEPRMMLKNASGLTWTGPRQVMFSEIKMGVHMALETSRDDRASERDVYIPAGEPDMAHRSYLSPDGKSVLLVEMVNDHRWKQCRLIPAGAGSAGRNIGPPSGGCTFAAWTPDGKWMYYNSNAVGGIHIWRQRFPDGQPEQVTSGPTEQEGIAMAPDGRSLITAVALSNTALWIHDGKGERQVSLEGNAADPRFTPDGRKLIYRVVREAPQDSIWYRDAGEILVADVETGRSEPLAREFQAYNYDLSPDGREIAMEADDAGGKSRVWLVPLDRSAPPRQIPNVEGGWPKFGLDGEILYFRVDGGGAAIGGATAGHVYRVKRDGTGSRPAIPDPVLEMGDVWQKGHRLLAWAPLGGTGAPVWQALSLDGAGAIPIFGAPFYFGSSPGGEILSMGIPPNPLARTFFIPSDVLARLPAGGLTQENATLLPGVQRIDSPDAIRGPSPDVYAFYRGTVQRNLYRIPIQ